jgi:large subunit ribosomal protein L37Ae
MPSKTKKVKSAGRFGVRYGRVVKSRLIEIELKQRKRQKCPYCGKLTARRISKGVWKCRNKKCGKKFVSNTYYLQ